MNNFHSQIDAAAAEQAARQAAAAAARVAEKRRSAEDAASKATADALARDAVARDEASRALNKVQLSSPLTDLKSPHHKDRSTKSPTQNPDDGDRASHQDSVVINPKLLLLAQQLGSGQTAKEEAERIARILRSLEALRTSVFESRIAYETTADSTKTQTTLRADRADRSALNPNLDDSGLSALSSRSDAIQRERNLLQLELLLEDPIVQHSPKLKDSIALAVHKLRGIVEDERRGLVEANARLSARLAELSGAFYDGRNLGEASFGTEPQFIRALSRRPVQEHVVYATAA